MISNRRALALAILFWTALALFETWPLVMNLDTHIFGFPGDPYFTIRALHVAAERLDHGLPFRWFWLGTHLPTYLPGVALTRLFSATLAYNILMLLSFPLSGLTMFLLSHYLTRNRLIAFVAATAYAFCPYHIAHATAHLDLSHIEWMPLVFLFLLKSAERPSIKNVSLLAGAYLLTLLGNYYYGFLTAIAAIAFEIADILAHALARSGAYTRLKNYARTLVAPAIVAAISLPFTWHIITNRFAYARDIRDLFRLAARPRDYLVPSPEITLFGGPFGDWIDNLLHNSYHSEQSLFLGFTILALAAVGLFYAARSVGAGLASAISEAAHPVGAGPASALSETPPPEDNRAVREPPLQVTPAIALAFAITALVCVVVSFPPVIDILGIQIKMPAYYLYFVAPMFRFYTRMGILVMLCVIALSAYGLHRVGRPFQAVLRDCLLKIRCLCRGDSRIALFRARTGQNRAVREPPLQKRTIPLGIALGLILAEFIVLPGGNLTSVAPRPIDQFLASLPNGGRVVEIVWPTLRNTGSVLVGSVAVRVPLAQIAVLHQLTHKKGIVTPLELMDAGISSRDDYRDLEKLRSLGVRYIIIRSSPQLCGPGGTMTEDALVLFYRQSPEVRLIGEFGPLLLFELTPLEVEGPSWFPL